MPMERNGQQDTRAVNIGQPPPSVQTETAQAAPPVEETASSTNDTADVTRGERLLRQENADSSGNRLENEDQARSTLSDIVGNLRRSPIPGILAQGDPGQDAVSSLLQTAPA
jgi:hypothetical protein